MVVLIAVLPVLAMCLIVWHFFSNGSYIKSQLVKADSYNKVIAIAPLYFDFFKDLPFRLSDQQKAQIFKDIVEPIYLQTTVEKSIDSFYLWLHGAPEFNFSIDLRPIKARIPAQILPLIDQQIKATPVCTQSDLLMLQSGSQEINCLPTKNYAVSAVDLNIEQIPDFYKIDMPSNFNKLPLYYQLTVKWGKTVVGASIVLLFLILLLSLPTIHKFLSSLGWILLWTGLTPLIFAILGSSTNAWIIPIIVPSNSDLIRSFLPDLIKSLSQQIIYTEFVVGGIIFICGLIFMTLAKVISNRSNSVITKKELPSNDCVTTPNDQNLAS